MVCLDVEFVDSSLSFGAFPLSLLSNPPPGSVPSWVLHRLFFWSVPQFFDSNYIHEPMRLSNFDAAKK